MFHNKKQNLYTNNISIII